MHTNKHTKQNTVNVRFVKNLLKPNLSSENFAPPYLQEYSIFSLNALACLHLCLCGPLSVPQHMVIDLSLCGELLFHRSPHKIVFLVGNYFFQPSLCRLRPQAVIIPAILKPSSPFENILGNARSGSRNFIYLFAGRGSG